MKNNAIKILIGMFLLITTISLASASISSLGTFKQNDCVNLLQTCSDCTYNNITLVLYPNSTQALGQVQMSQDGTSFNYTFCDTSTLGSYLVNGIGDLGGVNTIWNYDFLITSTSKVFSLGDIIVYILFLLICLTITFFSFRLTINNPMQKDEMTDDKLYDMKKRSEVKFYMALLKKKMWIVGAFGIYLSILAFIALFSQLTFSLGIVELTNILLTTIQILAWGLIPFALFWLVYVILFFANTMLEIGKHQYGNFRSFK